MYAAAEGHSNLGIPQAVGKEKVAASHGITDLPRRSLASKVGERLAKGA